MDFALASERWRQAAIGSIAEIRLGKMLQTEAADIADRPIPYLRAGSLSGLNSETELPAMYASPKDVEKFRVRAGDLIVAEGGDVGRTAFVPPVSSDTIIQNSLHRVRPRSGDVRFLRYALDAVYFSGWLDVLCNRATFGHLTVDKLSDIRIPWPTATNQRVIADWLDREMEQIDTLITAKQRMLELLEEQLASYREDLLIRNQVVQWIPLHRLTDPLRPIVYGIVQAGPEFPGGIPYIKTGDLPQLDPSTLSRTSPEIDEAYRRARVIPGDIVVAMRASIGTAVRVPPTLATANLTQGTARIAPGRGIDGRWLLHAFHTREVQEQCSVRAVGTTFKTLNIWDLRRVQIPQPDRNICSMLADQMDDHVEKCDRMTATLERQVNLLQERRQAIITAAVTGQLDIPEAA